MKVGRVYGAKMPHKTQDDAWVWDDAWVINTKPICHVNHKHISEVGGQNHDFITPTLESQSFGVPPVHRQASGASSQGGMVS